MATITTKDGTELYYKNWGQGQPIVFSCGVDTAGRRRRVGEIQRDLPRGSDHGGWRITSAVDTSA